MADKYKKRTIVFDDDISGHHLEYLHHLYMDAGFKSDRDFIFVVSNKFPMVSERMRWPRFENVTFSFLSNEEMSKLQDKNMFRYSYELSRLLKKKATELDTSCFFLVTLMKFLPFLPFLLGKNFYVSGIVYKIYLYSWQNDSLMLKAKNVLKYLLLSHFDIFKKVFILNDSSATCYLNRLYKTDRFQYLPDPFVPIPSSEIKNIRKELLIEENSKVFLHFGNLDSRKGTLEIMQAIELIPLTERSQYTFIFAGKVTDGIRKMFYTYYSELKDSVRILVYDEFCSFELIGSLCLTCDAILIPYKETNQSSGILGYAAQFKKQVIAPCYGLLGKIVQKNSLGAECMSSVTSQCINESFRKFRIGIWDENDYMEKHSVSLFLQSIDN